MPPGTEDARNKQPPEGWRPTRARLSREEEADRALNHTQFRPGTKWGLLILFVGIVFCVPVAQCLVELYGGSGKSNTFELLGSLAPNFERGGSWLRFWEIFPSAQTIKSTEKKLDDSSVLSRWALPLVQSGLTGWGRTGNKEVYAGTASWLFYRPDVEYVTGPPFLDPARLEQRRRDPGTQPDPIQAIIQFKSELTLRDVDLLVLPIPVKPCVEGDRLSSLVPATEILQNPSFTEFKRRLQEAGIRVLDLGPHFIRVKQERGNVPIYLETDTHWRPEIMELAAREVASVLGTLPSTKQLSLQSNQQPVTNLGDILTLLKLPPTQTIYRPETVSISTISSGYSLWHSDRGADVLVLGDSFCNIYSLEQMGWGESAGFVEHLSKALGGRPIDCILRNSDGAFATREILSHELSRGNDRLSGKKIVIWEFAARELAFGNWKSIEMELRKPAPSRFLTLKSGEDLMVTGVVQEMSEVPLPGSIPYKDHIAAIELSELSSSVSLLADSTHAVVYLWGMRDNVWTRAARLRSGDRVKLHLFSWDDYSAQYEKFNRSELEDPTLQLQDPTWGELIQ